MYVNFPYAPQGRSGVDYDVQSRPMSLRPVDNQLPDLRSPTTTPPHIKQAQREAKILRYSSSTDIPTANDKFLKTDSVVKLTVRVFW